jgi:hypothetical protein
MLVWMYGSYREFGDALYSLHEASVEHAGLFSAFAESEGRLRVIMYNAAFWPGVLIIGLSPLIFVSCIWGMIRGVIERRGIIWVILTVIIFGIYYYQSTVTGELSPLARYTILPGTILCLFAGLGVNDLAKRIQPARSIPIVCAVLLTGLVWAIIMSRNFIDHGDARIRKLASVSPVTHYPAALTPAMIWLGKWTGPSDLVIFSTPAFASNAIVLYSGIRPDQVVPVNEQDPKAIIDEISEVRPSLLILHRDSPLQRHFGSDEFRYSISIDDTQWHRDTVVGDFGIYRSAFR